MSRIHSYISTASQILGTYDGKGPFGYHLKDFFSGKKKYGSRDRKVIASLCYAYFRLGNALQHRPVEERIVAGLFLAENKKNEVLEMLRPELNDRVMLPVSEKLALLHLGYTDIFSFHNQLSFGIDKELFVSSFFKQPDLFLRIRPGKMKKVISRLTEAAVVFESVDDHCLRLANATALDSIIKINEEAVVQDYNSQHVFNFLEKGEGNFPATIKTAAWDCCAASGGKSILLHDVLKGKVELTVSDIRENILFNLVKRLQQAGVKIQEKFIADLSKEVSSLKSKVFSLIICDAPCTGSGTWSRTPEQLFYFDENSIDAYAERQKKIVSNIIPHLATNGLLFYITCSAFKKENEDVVDFIKEKFRLSLLQMEYLKGSDKKADTLFVAVFAA